MSEDLQLALLRYKNKKSWFKSGLLGFLIGLAVIVPGISGSTVAIIFKLYDKFLYSIGNLFKRFKICFLFLLPIGIGVVLGFALGFISVKQLLDLLPFAIICLFAGLMCGSFPAVKDELKGAQMNFKRIALFILGVAIPVAIGCVSAVMTAQGKSAGGEGFFDNLKWWHFVLAVAIGFVVGITQIVPGLSATAFLMTVGWYNGLMSSVSLTYWKSNPLVIFVYAGLGVGFLLGLFAFSKLLTFLFARARHTAYSMIVGLSLGSLISMFCNGDVMEVYISWATGAIGGVRIAVDVILGVVLFAIGFVGAYLLVRFERKKGEDSMAQTQENLQEENTEK